MIDTIKSDYRNITWYKTLSQTELQGIRDQTTAIRSSESYERIENSRDKFIAHDDRNKHQFDTKLSHKELWSIVTSLQLAYNTLHKALFNTTTHFDFARDSIEFEKLYRYQLITNLVVEKCKRSPDLGELEPVRKIIFGEIEE